MAFILEAVQVSKEIEGRQILRDISFGCSMDTKLLIRGKNGSGKSTLLKILAGITDPSNGKLMGSAQRIGYVPEHFPESMRFKLKEYLLLTASFRGGSKASIEDELSKYIQLFSLEPFLQTPLKSCSKGTKQKVGIIQALLMEPDVLLLDEPLTGLDAESQDILIQLLTERRTPIIFTSHEDVSLINLAKEVLQIETGEISRQTLNAVPKKRIRVHCSKREDVKDLPLSQLDFDGNIAVFTVEGDVSDQVLGDFVTEKLLHFRCKGVEVMVWGFIRYQFSSYLRSLTFIPPLTSYIAWIIIFYTYSGVPIMSSYAVTCISLYLVMTWVAMNIFALELESEKNLLFVQLPHKRDYLWGKWIVCLIIAAVLAFITIVYPLLLNSFKEAAQFVHISTVIYGHLFFAIFGILVGSFFSNTKVESKRFAWLSAALVIAISIAQEGISKEGPIFEWLLLPFPPVAQILLHFTDDSLVISKAFWLDAIWVVYLH